MPAKGLDNMPNSEFLARLMGPMGIAIGLGMLLNSRTFRAVVDEFLESRALIYLSGLMAGSAGLAIVLTHNVWSADWRLAITIIGWLGFVGGMLRIIMPQAVEAIGNRIFAMTAIFPIAGFVVFLLGLWLSFHGYIA